MAEDTVPHYTRHITNHTNGIQEIEHCAFGDKNYKEGYCVSLFRKYKHNILVDEYAADESIKNQSRYFRKYKDINHCQTNFSDIAFKYYNKSLY